MNEPEVKPPAPEKPKKKTEKNSHKKKFFKVRPPFARIERRCASGPFATREDFWVQLDEFVALESEAKSKYWHPISYADAAKYFCVSLQELSQTLNSRDFVKWMEIRAAIAAKIAARGLSPIISRKLQDLAEDNPKEFLREAIKYQKESGLNDASLDDVEELNEDEGNRLLKEFSAIWRDLSGGVEPNLHILLPRILGTRTGGDGRDHSKDDGAPLSAFANVPAPPSGPVAVVDTVPVAVKETPVQEKVQLRPRRKQAGEDGLAGSGRGLVRGEPTPVPEDTEERTDLPFSPDVQEDRTSYIAEIQGKIADAGEVLGLQPNNPVHLLDSGEGEGE